MTEIRCYRPGEHRGQPYQLYSKTPLNPGDPFQVSGPYDKWGKVSSLIREDNRGYLYLIHGTGNIKP